MNIETGKQGNTRGNGSRVAVAVKVRLKEDRSKGAAEKSWQGVSAAVVPIPTFGRREILGLLTLNLK